MVKMNVEDLLREIAKARIRNAENVDPPKDAAGIIIPENVMPLQPTEQTSIETRLEKYSSTTFTIPPISERWSNLPDFFTPTTHEFSDTKLLNESGYVIRKTTTENLAGMGRIVIPMLCSGFTRTGVVGLFTLAYNLKDSESANWEDAIDDIPAESSFLDTELDRDAEIHYKSSGQHKPFPATQDVRTEAAYYCYIAASVLRLFTKPPENYSKAWNHIHTNFTRFYSRSPPVIPNSPNIEVLRGLHSVFEMQKYKVTLFKLLYASSSNNRALGLKRFLYDLHLANPGLHVVDISIRLCKVLNVPSQKLIDIMNVREFRRQAVALAEMIRLVVSKADGDKRKMWRFGRIFDSTFMAELQTKACSKLVYILAYALKSEQPHGNENILDIVQLQNFSPDMKHKLSAAAQNVIKSLRSNV